MQSNLQRSFKRVFFQTDGAFHDRIAGPGGRYSGFRPWGGEHEEDDVEQAESEFLKVENDVGNGGVDDDGGVDGDGGMGGGSSPREDIGTMSPDYFWWHGVSSKPEKKKLNSSERKVYTKKF